MANERKLFFFTNSDVMVGVDKYGYYWTHRTVPDDLLPALESKIKQQGIKEKLQYLGIDHSLIARYNIYKMKQTKTQLTKKEQSIQDTVAGLIQHSMEDYYFAKIGETLIKYKETNDTYALMEELHVYVDSYNEHVPDKRRVSIETLLEGLDE